MLGKPIVAVADEIGTIRIFNFPNLKGETYYQSYSDHLFLISDCCFSPDRLFFVSACEMDKCVFKWKMHFNEDKITAMLDKEQHKLNDESVM
jgi:WD40 repeat protein